MRFKKYLDGLVTKHCCCCLEKLFVKIGVEYGDYNILKRASNWSVTVDAGFAILEL